MQPLTGDERGHIRRILNLAAQLPDDWSGMMSRSTLQEDFGALRFQLAYMSYALALAHVHRLPAAPGFFRKPFAQLIDKIRSPDVWTYWHYVGTGNGPFNQILGELPAQWDPVIKDNIMYSAYLQSMALLYHYLFDDARYAEKGALTLSLKPLFWSPGPKEFVYDERSLNEHIYWNMVENGYLGIACEPNCVFQICNQVPILGFRLHDMIYGGTTAKEVTDGYKQAWAEFGMVNERGHYTMMIQERERTTITPESPWSDFWGGSLMHAWNPDFVQKHYPRQVERWVLPGPGGTAWVDQGNSAFSRNGLPSSLDFGWAAVCASEVGDLDTRDRLLSYADQFLHRSWDQGGLFYRRHDTMYDDEGRFSCVDPHTGNALLAYARLNVPHGLRKLYEGALAPDHHRNPAIADVEGDVDFLSARWDGARRMLEWSVAPFRNERTAARFEIGNAPQRGYWSLRTNSAEIASCTTDSNVQRSEAGRVYWEGERLIIECDIADVTAFELIWTNS